MSSEIAISVRDLSKVYRIYDKPEHRLIQMASLGRIRPFKEFAALHDVSLEVRRGETVGIVGRNGCGKSTLLQIICGTLQPTRGSVAVHGRIAALLELGAGFSGEFTGRENVYMNGAILGFSREEMDARFDQIAQFAGIGEFIERPVKTYSSGMFVRLAFAVATAVEPDILIVDEALAVGDIRFQTKCIQKIREMRDRGVSILFVSHSPGTIEALCDRAIWLEQGSVRRDGAPSEVMRKYTSFMRHGVEITEELGDDLSRQPMNTTDWLSTSRSENVRAAEGALIPEFRYRVNGASNPTTIDCESARIEIEFKVKSQNEISRPLIACGLFNELDEPIVHFNSYTEGREFNSIASNMEVTFYIAFHAPGLRPGSYLLALGIDDGDFPLNHLVCHIHDAALVTIRPPRNGRIQAGYIVTKTTEMASI